MSDVMLLSKVTVVHHAVNASTGHTQKHARARACTHAHAHTYTCTHKFAVYGDFIIV